MRWIEKPADPPASIRDYLAAQVQVGHGFDYPTFAGTASPGGGSRGGQLRGELAAQQYGLCAYTGAGIDDRLGRYPPQGHLKFTAHNEHLKPQKICREELIAAGRQPGMDIGDDMDHRNIVAALLVSGHGGGVDRNELFGASRRGDNPVPVLPTYRFCEQRFSFGPDGSVGAAYPGDQAAIDTIAVLNLQNPTLAGWRAQAISIFMEGVEDRADAERIIEVTTHPTAGKLPEYCFAIRQVVQQFLDIAQ